MTRKNKKIENLACLNVQGNSVIRQAENKMNISGLLIPQSLNPLITLIVLIVVIMLSATSVAADKSKKVLILNSNASVKKYFMMQNEFKAKSKYHNVDVDLGSKWKSEKWLKNTIRNANPDLIFCIGSKAYDQASNLAKKIPKIFSLGINWRRMSISENTYVVASEVPVTTQLMMFRYFFPEIKTIGVLYSKTNNKKWYRKAVSEANDMEINIIGKAIKKDAALTEALQDMLPKVDALWLIPDPVILSGKEQVTQIFKESSKFGKPVFAYEKIFGDFGAAFIVSADVPTMARQAAQIAANALAGKDIGAKVQDPAGSYIAINLKKIEMYGVKLNSKAIPSVNDFIEESK
ncbi:MAG: ABC transporter substrate-binding protein [Candidatus Anammoxibacter sp.]